RTADQEGAEVPAPRLTPTSRDVGGDLHRHDLVGVLHRLPALDLVDVLHAIDDLAPDSVLAVEEGRVPEADEELAVGRVRALRPGHGAGAADMWLAVELGLEVLARAAGAGAGWIAALRHEALDDAVERRTVVKAAAGKLLDAGDMVGGEVGAECDGRG